MWGPHFFHHFGRDERLKDIKPKKNIIAIFKDVLYLLRPMLKYAKSYIAVHIILIAMIATPLGTLLNVYYQKTVIDSLVIGKSFAEIALIIVFFEVSTLAVSLIHNTFNTLYSERKNTEINASINKEIYDKAINTDYKYFDNPEFFDNYTWTIQQYASRSQLAYQFIFSTISSLVTLSALIAVIASNDFVILIISVCALTVTTFFSTRMNKTFMKKQEEQMNLFRRQGTIQSVMYWKGWADGLKCTLVYKFLMEIYRATVAKMITVIKNTN
ncbi:MAG: hypothetical protein FWF15_09500 [Oscillospiraceae bacterium]|nr:hypothetical protein [Oscillospiraceae bacterium]